ncbi:MAG: cupredoxin domain-containing protein [Kofleriaceae bacterium]|nr:cupredoxin domain-containing protein [Myxococcales bacterium]MCB9561140.1 cupredoxin domain-containing protein [Kofleriaceae bacterium]MCB9571337.1 cupredoxin domain-containing protein [Kofleriaceae bacterium]
MRLTSTLLTIVVGSVLALGACKKDEATSKPADPVGTVGPDGIRRVAIEAGRTGYKPDRIPAKPGEKLILVFTRTVDGECLSQVKVADGALTPLPMNTPVEIPVTAPASGDLRFACGMDMQTGVVAVN